MAQQVKVLATKSDDLRSFSRAQITKGETELTSANCPDFCVHIHTHINKHNESVKHPACL